MPAVERIQRSSQHQPQAIGPAKAQPHHAYDQPLSDNDMNALNDFQKYHDLRREMQSMIRSGKIHYITFDDIFAEFVEITKRHGGLPPVPTDIDAADQELAEMGVEKELR